MKEIRLVADHTWSYLESWMTGSTPEDSDNGNENRGLIKSHSLAVSLRKPE